MNRNRWPLVVVALMPLALLTCGCGRSGPKTYTVTGTVSYQGSPLPLGTVMFVSKEGPPSKPALIDKSGNYRLEAVAGEHRVQVIAMPTRPGGRPDPGVEGGVDYAGVANVRSLVPEKYNRHDTSGIKVDVVPGESNRIDIVLD